MIKFISVNKSYVSSGKEVTALQNINLTVDMGEIFGIVGTSGAGKSTLLHLVNKLEQPDNGEVWLNNRLVNNLSGQDLIWARQETGMIFQHFNLLESHTCYENIIFPLRINKQLKKLSEKQLAEKINPILELTGLTHLVHHYPSQLSGGQKQRVGIARSLITNPKVLLCDECTSALDPETTNSILYLLKKINKELGVTILLITHEMSVVKNICHRVAVMSHGQIVEQGNVLELFAFGKNEITQKILSTNLLDKLPESIRGNMVTAEIYKASQTHQNNNLFPLVQLVFVNTIASKPVLSEIISQYNIHFNILQGGIETVQDTIIGKLIMQIEASSNILDQIVVSLNAREIKVEIVGYAVRIY
ncbi:MAG: ATP-binding cassette domain-containing protein [Gammaproteobacteria bacterium]|nr:ATP-binding cassette domain-containing protein [Gammaproteobacteria bacterium]